jgi:hypothetical protein
VSKPRAVKPIYCIDCKRPGSKMCDACKEQRKALHGIHTAPGKLCPVAEAIRAKRIPLYAARAAKKLPLFE